MLVARGFNRCVYCVRCGMSFTKRPALDENQISCPCKRGSPTFAITSDDVDTVIDIHPCRFGKELAAARNLLNGLRVESGLNFVDIIVGDALYMSKEHIRECKEDFECDVLVKSKRQYIRNRYLKEILWWDKADEGLCGYDDVYVVM